jgi:hypothetical protein
MAPRAARAARCPAAAAVPARPRPRPPPLRLPDPARRARPRARRRPRRHATRAAAASQWSRASAFPPASRPAPAPQPVPRARPARERRAAATGARRLLQGLQGIADPTAVARSAEDDARAPRDRRSNRCCKIRRRRCKGSKGGEDLGEEGAEEVLGSESVASWEGRSEHGDHASARARERGARREHGGGGAARGTGEPRSNEGVERWELRGFRGRAAASGGAARGKLLRQDDVEAREERGGDHRGVEQVRAVPTRRQLVAEDRVARLQR